MCNLLSNIIFISFYFFILFRGNYFCEAREAYRSM